MKSAFLTLALLAAPALAVQVDNSVTLSAANLDVRVRNVWPEGVQRGWMPVQLEAHNRSELPQRLKLAGSTSSFQSACRYRAEFALAPGERVNAELLLPAVATWESGWNLRLESDRGDQHIASGGTIGGSPERLAILAVSEETVAPSVVAAWSEKTSRNVINGQWSPTGTVGNNDDARIALTRFADLPRSASAYTSLDLVVVDARRELPPDAQLEPLMAWVRSGGTALFVGPTAKKLAQTRGALAPWMEERFRFPDDFRQLRICGLGTLAFHDSAEWFDDGALRDTAYELANRDNDVAPGATGTSRTTGANPKIPGLATIPRHIFALLLILFALVIGPLNFYWIAKRKRPVLLLVTIPALALVTTVALLLYGIFFQGLDVKSASTSVALLDERLHRSACIEDRLWFAGLSPGAGLRPEAGTHVHLPGEIDSSPLSALGRAMEIENPAAPLLSGDYLPTRIPVEHVTISERAARGRVELRRAGDTFEITNGLGTRIEELFARDLEGNWHSLATPVEQGASAKLALSGAPSLALLNDPFSLLGILRGEQISDFPVGCYLARLDRSPFRDNCGIETTELASDHRLFGVWPLDAEVWK